jgi:hypothetical protein
MSNITAIMSSRPIVASPPATMDPLRKSNTPATNPITMAEIISTVEVPIDNLIANWTEETLPADWQVIRARWSTFHTVRTFLSLGAVAAAVGAALTVRTRDREVSQPSVVQADRSAV